MSRKNAALLAELKRAGFPFDPTRSSNWFAGVLRSLLARNHPTDRVDLLAKQTLKQMNILTKGERREFILRQVENAIQQLCKKDVLFLYTPTRVRLWDALSQPALERYLNISPIPWGETAPAKISRRATTREPDADYNPITPDTPDLFDEAFPTMPKIGASVALNMLEEDSSPKHSDEPREQSTGPWAPEETLTIDAILPSSHIDKFWPENRSTPPASSVENEIQHGLLGGREVSSSRLDDIVLSIQNEDQSMRILASEGRTVVLDSSHGGQLDLELRRGGELRVFISFPDYELSKVLRYVGSRWLDLVVALDARGRYGVQRVIPNATSTLTAADIILKIVQELDDAMKDGQ